MRHRGGAFVDLLPCGDVVTHGQRLRLADGVELNMAGFARVIPSAVSVTIGEGLTLPVARLPLWSLLKLVAYSDRRAPKDLAAVFHALQHYLEDDDRRYLAEHAGVGVPFEYTCAYLLGADATPFLDDPVRQAVATVLGTFDGPDAQAVTTVAMERGRGMVEDREREQISEHFRWYRLGAGI
jgi:predicted nucleotidyltransferase